MKKNVLNSPRLLELKKRQRRVVFNKFILSLIALAIIFGSLAYIARLPNLNISEVKILSSKSIEVETTKKIVEEQIAGNYLWFFPKTNFLIYPKHQIENVLKNKFKKIKDVSVNNRNIKTLEVSITEREAKYLWCGDNLVVGVLSEEKCHFMDVNGFVFDEAPYFSGEVYFKFYGSLSQVNFEKLILFKKTLRRCFFNFKSRGEFKTFLFILYFFI